MKCAERSTRVTSSTNLYIFLKFDMGVHDKKLATSCLNYDMANINPLNAKLNPICHLLALLGAYHILHISK
jgi:hypothetical protein